MTELTERLLAWKESLLTIVNATLSGHGVAWLLATLALYQFALWVNRKGGGSPLLHPLTLTALGVGILVYWVDETAIGYQHYAGMLHWLLGPATVALALPLFSQWQKVRQLGWRLFVAVGIGGIIAPILAWSLLYWADAPHAIQMTMLVKSITSPLAMEAGALIGGIPALAAVFVIVTGIVGAITSPTIYQVLRITSPSAQGVTLGTVCHAVGTARALQMGEQQGALATLGLCLNGIMTALILPAMLS